MMPKKNLTIAAIAISALVLGSLACTPKSRRFKPKQSKGTAQTTITELNQKLTEAEKRAADAEKRAEEAEALNAKFKSKELLSTLQSAFLQDETTLILEIANRKITLNKDSNGTFLHENSHYFAKIEKSEVENVTHLVLKDSRDESKGAVITIAAFDALGDATIVDAFVADEGEEIPEAITDARKTFDYVKENVIFAKHRITISTIGDSNTLPVVQLSINENDTSEEILKLQGKARNIDESGAAELAMVFQKVTTPEKAEAFKAYISNVDVTERVLNIDFHVESDIDKMPCMSMSFNW
jgi:hypothetical protein